MTAPFVLLVSASLLLFALHFPFAQDVRARHFDLLPMLHLEPQPEWTRWARLNRLLLPYWSFILCRTFQREFANDSKLYRLAETMYWVQLAQLLALVTLAFEFIVGLGGTVLHV